MKITTINNIDLTKYKLAYFTGDSLSHNHLCQDKVMKLAESGLIDEDDYSFNGILQIALIPKEARLTECSGDDWNDTPAECNASGFYTYPEGTIFLEGVLGQELILKGNRWE